MNQAVARFDRAQRAVGIGQHGSGHREGHLVHLADHEFEPPQVAPRRQAQGQGAFDVDRLEVHLPFDLRPIEGGFVKRAADELLQLPIDLDAQELQLQLLVFQLVQTRLDGAVVDAVGNRDRFFAEIVDAVESPPRFVGRQLQEVFLRFETGQLIKRFEGRGGGIVANARCMQRHQIAVETIILSNGVRVTFDHHPGPMALKLHHVGHGRIGGGAALARVGGEQMVSFLRRRQGDQFAVCTGESGQIGRLAVDLCRFEHARRARSARHATA